MVRAAVAKKTARVVTHADIVISTAEVVRIFKVAACLVASIDTGATHCKEVEIISIGALIELKHMAFTYLAPWQYSLTLTSTVQ